MAKSFRKVYTNEAEYIHDLAKSASLYRVKGYEAAIDKDQYAYAIAGTLNKESSTFDLSKYNHMDGELGYNYLLNEFYTDKNSEQYKENKAAIEYQWQRQLNKETYDSLNGFEKAMGTIGGIIGNAGNELLFGTIEGLIDVFGTAAGQTDFVAKDITGYTANKQALQEFNEKYTLIDKSKIVGVANEVVSGLAKLSINMIPYAGPAIYYGSMMGNVAEEAAVSNPDIEWYELMAYTASVGIVEALTEKISGKIFGGSAIDNLIFKTSSGKAGSWLTRIGMDFISEGMEESIAEVADTTLWNAIVAQNNGELRREYSIKDILHAGLIGGLIGSIGASNKIISTKNQFVTKSGAIVDAKFAKENKLEGHKLTKIQTLSIQERLKAVNDKLKTSEMSKLEIKYNMSRQDLKTQHAEEYNKALEADKELTLELGEACLGLAKLFEKIGYEDFAKAAELATYVENKKKELQETYEAMENRANLIKGLAKQDALLTMQIDDKLKKKYGADFAAKIDFDFVMSPNEAALKTNMKKHYGVDIHYVDFGQLNGLDVHHSLTLDENTILIQKGLANEMSPQQILKDVVAHELSHTLQYEDGILKPSTLIKLDNELGITYDKRKLKPSKDAQKNLTKYVELQAEAIAQKVLFDQLTIDKMFICSNENYSKVYRWLKGLKAAHENRKTRKTEKDKIRYNQINKIMNSYKKAVANNIGNDDDLEIAKNKMTLSEDEYEELKKAYKTNGINKHYLWLKDSSSLNTYKRKKAYDTLLNNFSEKVENVEDIEYDKIFNEFYYKPEFAEMIKSMSDRDFKYNLQDYMIKNFNFVINQKDMCLMEIFDFNKIVKPDFLKIVSDIDNNRYVLGDRDLYKKWPIYFFRLADILTKDFLDSLSNDTLKELWNVTVRLDYVDNLNGDFGYYKRKTKEIVINIPYEKTDASYSLLLKDVYFHEFSHAFADIQGLSRGCNPETIRYGLESLDKNDLLLLAEGLLNRYAYENYKYAFDIDISIVNMLKDYLANAIYLRCDGEFAAEAYTGSYNLRDFNETEMKASYTLNKSGFMVYDGKIWGYGRFKGIEISLDGEKQITDTTKDEYLFRPFKDLFTFKKSSDFKAVLRRLNITDFRIDSIGETIYNKLKVNGNITKSDLLKAIFEDKRISHNVRKEYVKIYAKTNGNENIKVWDDIEKNISNFFTAYTYYRLVKLSDGNIHPQEKIDIEDMEVYNDKYKDQDERRRIQASVTSYLGENVLFMSQQILKIDFDTSYEKVNRLYELTSNDIQNKKIKERKASESVPTGSKNDYGDETRVRETGTYEEDLGYLLYEKGVTDEELEKAFDKISEEDAIKAIEKQAEKFSKQDYIVSEKYNILNEKELQNAIDKGEKIYDVSGESPKEIDLGDGRNYKITETLIEKDSKDRRKGKTKKQLSVIDTSEKTLKELSKATGIEVKQHTVTITDDVKHFTDKPEKFKTYHTGQPSFKYLSRLRDHKDFLVGRYGEDFWNKLFDEKNRVLPLSKQSYVRQINTQKQKIEKINTLSIKDSAIVNVDYSDFSPKEFEEYITRLKGIVKKHKKVLTEARAKERLKATKAPSTHAASNIVAYEIATDEDISLANKIESLFVNEKFSQAQTEGDQQVYVEASIKTIKENPFIFYKITPKNYLQIRKELMSRDTPAAKAALNVISIYVYMMKDLPAFKELKSVIVEKKNESITFSAQEMGLWSSLIRNQKPISGFVSSMNEQGVEMTTDDESMINIIKTNVENFNSIEERISLLEKESNDIREEIKSEIEKSEQTDVQLDNVENFKNQEKQKLEESQKLEQEIDKLEQENQKLEQEIDKLEKKINENKTDKKLVKENEKLKNQIDVIKKKSEEIKTKSKDLLKESNKLKRESEKIKSEYQQLLDENKKLKQENKKLKEESVEKLNDLSDRLLQINNELEALKSGNILDTMDYYATHCDSLKVRNKIQKETMEALIKNAIEKNKDISIEFNNNKKKNKSLNEYPDAFPKLSNFVKKTVNAMEQFRITAMLSSPMTWVRNYVNNQLMRGLNAATNAIERTINETATFQKLYEHSGQYKYVATKADKKNAKEVTKNLTAKYEKEVTQWLGSKSNKTDTSAVKSETKLAALEVQRQTTNNPVKRALLTIQQKVYEQLETGKLGDRPMATKVTLQCMGEILVANKDKFLRDLENTFGPLDKIKKRRSLTDEQKKILEAAYTEKTPEAIFEAITINSAMYEHFMTIAASRSIEIFFKNDNWLSTALRNISDKSLTARMAINLISPFYKVGANILSMAYKYSPLNFLSAITKLKRAKMVTADGYVGYSTGFEAAEASKSFAQATVGSALWIAGMLAAALGVIDIDEDDYLGPSLYLFGFRISLSDTAPATTSLSVGAVLMHTWKNKKVFDLELFMDVMYSNTLLGTVENVFKYTDESSFLSNLGTNYITSYIPAVLKLTQKVFDGKYRDKTGTGKTKMGKWLSTTWKSIIASLPGLSYALPTKTDPYTGKASTRYGTNSFILNIAQALIPFTTSAKKLYTSEFEKEAVSVGAETSGLSGNFTINGKDFKVTGKTKETLSKYRVKYITSELDKMKSGKRKITIEDENGKRKTTTYNKLTDEEKKKVLTSLYSEATISTKIKYWIDAGNKYVTSNKEEYKKYKELYKSSRIIYKEKWSKSKFVEV